MPTVLVIDDDRDSRELLCLLLRRHGYETVEANNGREALAALDRLRSLCLILLDLMMPVMDGWEFRRRQMEHARFSGVPVVVLTADVRMNGHAADLQAVRLFTKPVDVTDVLSVVHELCPPA